MVWWKTLVFGIIIVDGLLPALANYALPKPRHKIKEFRPIQQYFSSNRQYKSVSGEFDDNYNFRTKADDKVYIIALDPESQLYKNLENLPIQNGGSEELPAKKTLPMLPLVDTTSDETDIDNQYRIIKSNTWAKLFNKNGKYKNPKERVKSILRSDPATEIKSEEPRIYSFSDLVL